MDFFPNFNDSAPLVLFFLFFDFCSSPSSPISRSFSSAIRLLSSKLELAAVEIGRGRCHRRHRHHRRRRRRRRCRFSVSLTDLLLQREMIQRRMLFNN